MSMVFVIAEEGDNMYERYDKNGNLTHYRISKRVKCINGTTKYIVAQSKTSERGCKYRLSRKLKEFYAEQEEERRKLPSPDMRFKYFAANWYETNIKYSNTTQSNKNEYKSIVFKKLIPWFGEMSLCEITEDECQRFLNEYKGYAKSTVKTIRMTMRKIFKKALKQGLIEINPAEDIIYPEVKKATPRRPITDEERTLILETAPTNSYGPMMLTMLYAGLRPIEIRRMTWDWIDFEANVITVGQSKTEAGNGRKIPIIPPLRKALLMQYENRRSDKYTFCNEFPPYNKMTAHDFNKKWEQFKTEMDTRNRAKDKSNKLTETTLANDLIPYLLRHTFCTDCQAAGVPINVAKEFMGHADIAVTSKIYTHMVNDVFQENRKRLEKYQNEKEKL